MSTVPRLPCPGDAPAEVRWDAQPGIHGHWIEGLGTPYGARWVCRLHRRVWSQVKASVVHLYEDGEQGPEPFPVEDVYAEGGMVHHES